MLAAALPDDLATTLFQGKKRGFNPPLSTWLHEDLADRYDGLGSRLEHATAGQMRSSHVDAFVTLYRGGCNDLAENILQLLMLDESLSQLRELGLK